MIASELMSRNASTSGLVSNRVSERLYPAVRSYSERGKDSTANLDVRSS